jgi:SAF domain-containing protein
MTDPSPGAELLASDLEQLATDQPDAPRLAPADAAHLSAALRFETAPLTEGAWEALEAKLVAEDEAPRVSLSCTYCHDSLNPSAGQALAYCASCLAPHHRDCFEGHARCSAPGCAETRWVQPQSSGQAPQPAVAASGKPELRVLPAEPGSEPERAKRRLATLVASLAASFIGVGVAAFSLYGPAEVPTHVSSGNWRVLTYARTIHAGEVLTRDDLVSKEISQSKGEASEESGSPLITESRLSGFLGRRLDQRVLEGELVRVRQFRAPDHLPQGATLETYVFTHDVQPGEVLTQGDFERRRVAWSMVWEAPDQRLLHDSQVGAFLGRRLSRVGRGGEPLRFTHFESLSALPLVTPLDAWVPTPAEEALALSLSSQGRNLIRLARPVQRARAYLLHHGLEQAVNLDEVEVASYCPPQTTLYAWLVTFEDGKGNPIYIAVSEAGRTWQLDEKFQVVRPAEFSKGGLIPR